MLWCQNRLLLSVLPKDIKSTSLCASISLAKRIPPMRKHRNITNYFTQKIVDGHQTCSGSRAGGQQPGGLEQALMQ